MKRLAILGSTGSIGEQAIDVVSSTEGLEIVALSAHSNWERAVAQARALGVEPAELAPLEDAFEDAAHATALRVSGLAGRGRGRALH